MSCWSVCVNGARATCGSAAVAVEHKLFFFGGPRGNMAPMEVHIFNTVSLRWRKLSTGTAGRGEECHPQDRPVRGHTAVLVDDIIYIWGGKPYCNVLYAFDVDAHTWSKPGVSGTVPEARDDHSACVLRKDMIIYGGFCLKIYNTNEIYKLDTSTMVWTLINTRLSQPLYGHSATIIGTKMFVFGGYWYGKYYDDIRVFDTERNLWLTTPSVEPCPIGRLWHSAFNHNGELYIFGGWNLSHSQEKSQINDLWRFNIETFSWKKVEPKGKDPSENYKMCCCKVGDRLLFFGDSNKLIELSVLDFNPSLKTLCKIAVIQYALDHSGLPHNIRWELAGMTTGH